LLTNRTTDIFEDQLEEIAIPDVWGDGRIMLIGDAVHAMPPYMAQGGSLALEDAEAAAEIVASGDLSDAAQRLSAARASRTRWVQERNRRREKLTKLPFGIAKLGIRLVGRKSWIADLRPLATPDN
jgi:2-polyprenyl-6-methoxyphenol hydroxylase-like FAD-dependent oxidoreductase